MRLSTLVTLVTLWAYSGAFAIQAKGHRDWEQSLARLHAGDRVHISLKSGPVDTTFVSFTAQDFTTDTGTLQRDAVLKVERFQNKKGRGRGRHALIGALIGAGAGAGIGALVGYVANNKSCTPNGFLVPCNLQFITTGEFAGGLAGVGAVVGAAVGALLPTQHTKLQMIYSAE